MCEECMMDAMKGAYMSANGSIALYIHIIHQLVTFCIVTGGDISIAPLNCQDMQS